jgi:MurNAc alpha-1-phosphate uridylyltransferase
MLPVAILAGGLATRLRPMTDRVPKALLGIAGRPFIFHQLRLLKSEGIDRVVLCVGHLGEQVKAAVGDGGNLGLTIQYSFDGNELLGTGGALKKALPLLGKDFFVLNGDSYLPCSFARIESAYKAARRPALMTVLRNDSRWDKSNVLFRNGELIEYDKTSPRLDMSHIDFGLSVLSDGVFAKYRESKTIDLADIYRELSKDRQLAAVEVLERFYEIGSPQGIRDTEVFLSSQ